jgi:aminoglycoside phosphotransferase (APT) family kinase protein
VSGEPASHHHGARSIAAVHRAWADRIDEALALGAPDRRAPAALPHTLVHGDFHAGNVLGSTILDGSDAAVANPLHDLNHYLLHRDPAQRDALVATMPRRRGRTTSRSQPRRARRRRTNTSRGPLPGSTVALADDDRWRFAAEEARRLGFANAVRAGRRPGLAEAR